MKRVSLMGTLVLAAFLGGCSVMPNATLEDRTFLFGSDRKRTLNDAMASWVGHPTDALVTSWGPPLTSYRRSDGATILTWKEVIRIDYEVGVCEKSFLASPKGIIEKWRYTGGLCQVIYNDQPYIPKSTHVPKPTL